MDPEYKTGDHNQRTEILPRYDTYSRDNRISDNRNTSLISRLCTIYRYVRGFFSVTLLPETFVGTHPELAEFSNCPKAPDKFSPGETPLVEVVEELALEEPELLISIEEEVLT